MNARMHRETVKRLLHRDGEVKQTLGTVTKILPNETPTFANKSFSNNVIWVVRSDRISTENRLFVFEIVQGHRNKNNYLLTI